MVRQAIDHTKAGRSLEAAMALQYADLPQSLPAEQTEQAVAAG